MPNYAGITIVGHVGKDAELKYTENGVTVCEFSLAVNNWRRSEDPANWYRVSYWGNRGETIARWINKGDPVLVSGGLWVREYEYNGEKRYSLDIRADAVELLRGRDEWEAPPDAGPPPAEDLSDLPF